MARAKPLRTELAKGYTGVADGHIEPPNGPGCGIKVGETVLERYPAIPGPRDIPGRAGE